MLLLLFNKNKLQMNENFTYRNIDSRSKYVVVLLPLGCEEPKSGKISNK